MDQPLAVLALKQPLRLVNTLKGWACRAQSHASYPDKALKLFQRFAELGLAVWRWCCKTYCSTGVASCGLWKVPMTSHEKGHHFSVQRVVNLCSPCESTTTRKLCERFLALCALRVVFLNLCKCIDFWWSGTCTYIRMYTYVSTELCRSYTISNHIIYDSYIYMIIYVHGSLELRSSVVVLKVTAGDSVYSVAVGSWSEDKEEAWLRQNWWRFQHLRWCLT